MTTQLTANPYNISVSAKSEDSLPLFFIMSSDHILTDAEAIGWALQGSLVTNVYPDAVNAIKNLYINGEDTQYRGITSILSTDGRYIADISQKGAIDELFASTGVADFYVLDTENNSFYLPKTNWFFKPCMDTSLVNQYNEAGLPNIAQDFGAPAYTPVKGGLFNISMGNSSLLAGNSTMKENSLWSFDASRENPIYGNSDTVQPPSSNKFLYYKVGNTVVNQSLIDVGNVLSELQSKVNPDLSNCTKSYILEMSSLDILPSFYILFSNGLLIQGGRLPASNTSSYVEVTLLKEYRDDNYWATSLINAAPEYSAGYVGKYFGITKQTSKSVSIFVSLSNIMLSRTWITIGYAKAGEDINV